MVTPGRVQLVVALFFLFATLTAAFALSGDALPMVPAGFCVCGILIAVRDPWSRAVLRVLAFAIMVLLGWAGIVLVIGFSATAGGILLAFALIAATISWGLSGEDAVRHFALRCPYCRSTRTRPRLWRRVSCRRCEREWGVGERVVDPTVFD